MTEPHEVESLEPVGRFRRMTIDLSPIRSSRGYRNLLIGDSISVIGTQVTAVAVPLQVYDLTRSATAVGLVGLVGLLPLVVFGLYGGAVADAVDRRKLVLVTTVAQIAVALVLLGQVLAGVDSVGLLYVLIAVQSGIWAIESPARQAFVPRLVPVEMLPAANALRQLEFNIGLTLGPLIAGVLIVTVGFEGAYLLDALSFTAALWAVASLPSMTPEGGGRRAGLASVLEGLRFLMSRKVLLLTFVVDIVAMVFGMVRALFAPLADQVFDSGPSAAGAMYSALAVGALVAILFGGWFGRVHRQGLAVMVAIVGWGVCIILFGLTSSLWLALIFMAGAGAADSISAVYRIAILQTAAADAMRGRLAGVFLVVVAGGPRIGDIRAGGMASWLSLQESIVIGGVLVIVLTVVVGILVPSFARYDSRHPEA